MARIIQLSDLHLVPSHGDDAHRQIVESLFAAFEHERERRGGVDLIAITGDVFDCASTSPAHAVAVFDAFVHRLMCASNMPVPIVVIPGNHDRRKSGIFGASRTELWNALYEYAREAEHPIWVQNANPACHAHVVPRSFHRLPLTIIAYDSTWVGRGYVSAGGNIRREDLLFAISQAEAREPTTQDTPVVVLVHHHIVPTPQTDLGKVETNHMGALARRSFEALLPTLFAHADHEELTMTALGAGTALSTLHSFGRPVVVLHGHKHIASARVLLGPKVGQGDVAVVGAGSAGSAQVWSSVATQKPVHLWPSFNSMVVDGSTFIADAITFGYKGSRTAHVHIRPLLWLRREGARFRLVPVESGVRSPGPRLIENKADYKLSPSIFEGRLDYTCERTVTARKGLGPKQYFEPVPVYAGTRFSSAVQNGSVQLSLEHPTNFLAEGAVAASVETLRANKGIESFESIALFNRYEAEHATLVVRNLPSANYFATSQDLGSGDEVRLAIEVSHQNDQPILTIRVSPCAPRTLIRLYFPVAAGDAVDEVWREPSLLAARDAAA